MTKVSVKATEGNRPVVLVAIEPRFYAHAIGTVIGQSRPLLDVRIVEPEDLSAEVLRLRPRLVLCSRPDGRPDRDGATAWVEFYPYAEAPPRVKIRMDDRCSTLEDADLTDLLSIVDGRRFPSRSNGQCTCAPRSA